ncbi:MAG: cytochrome c biogenesis protein ResB [Magnetococcales bacterium]|nr:cytochrome c biogenesis protein ResB [Magnetococcales bacterium]
MASSRWTTATHALAPGLFGLALNFLAALSRHPAFRRQPPLLVFHAGLACVVVLIGLGRLTYLKGWVEVADGNWFEGKLHGVHHGPWSPLETLETLRFRNDGFTIRYAPGRSRQETDNPVTWLDRNGQFHTATIGDNHPLVIQGFRFTTSHNKGFVPRFLWMPADGGTPVRGAVHLPSYPSVENQVILWQIPGTGLWVHTHLLIDESPLDPTRTSWFQIPPRFRLRVKVGEVAGELHSGDSLALPGGVLRFEELGKWMGYKVFYDPTMPWLLAASLVTVAGLFWQLSYRFRGIPWDRDEPPVVPANPTAVKQRIDPDGPSLGG